MDESWIAVKHKTQSILEDDSLSQRTALSLGLSRPVPTISHISLCTAIFHKWDRHGVCVLMSGLHTLQYNGREKCRKAADSSCQFKDTDLWYYCTAEAQSQLTDWRNSLQLRKWFLASLWSLKTTLLNDVIFQQEIRHWWLGSGASG